MDPEEMKQSATAGKVKLISGENDFKQEGMSTLFTCLDLLEQEQTPELMAKKKKYMKKSGAKQTLVFEIIDVFL